jgi:HD-GYP domain-containing protein (c-di-GMP phosphodiesterase class II)
MKLDVPVLHQSGITLVEPGKKISSQVIDLLKEKSVATVFILEKSERIEQARRDMVLTPIPVDNIKEGERLAKTIYDTKGTLLLEAGSTIPKSFAKSLSRRGIKQIYYRKTEDQLKRNLGIEVHERIEYLTQSSKKALESNVENLDSIELPTVNSNRDLVETQVAHKIDSADNLIIMPEGEALEKEINVDNKLAMHDEEEKENFLELYEESLESTANLFRKLANTNIANIDGSVVRSIAQNTVAGLIRNRELMMVASSITLSSNYLVSHSLGVAVAAINIGAALGFSKSQILSLGHGALLHDVGMLRVNATLREKPEKINNQEWNEIKKHPGYGLDMLQKIVGIPVEVPFVVYQSHERVNGSGYPRGKKDVVIHTYAKIVAIADIYNSICSKRPYREAMTPYEAMEQLVLMCGKKLIDVKSVKAFLKCNSMFPVGSWVELSDGAKARVVASKPEDYMKPFVTVVFDGKGEKVKEPFKQDLSETSDVKIVKALSQKEIESVDLMEGF